MGSVREVAALQGPAHPWALAAAARGARRVSRGDRALDRLRDLARAFAPARGDRRSDTSGRDGDGGLESRERAPVRRAAVLAGSGRGRGHARTGTRKGRGRRSARCGRDPCGHRSKGQLRHDTGAAGSRLQRQRAAAVPRSGPALLGARAGEPRLLRADTAGGLERDQPAAARGEPLRTVRAGQPHRPQRDPAAARSRDLPPAQRRRPRGARTGRRVRQLRRGEPHRVQARARERRPTDQRAHRDPARAAHATRHIRGGRRGQHLRDVRVPAARRRRARARARGAHSRAARARPRIA